MGQLPENNNFDGTVYQFETTDVIQGGAGGVANSQGQNLTNRTRWLFNQVSNILASLAGYATQAFVGSSIASRQPLPIYVFLSSANLNLGVGWYKYRLGGGGGGGGGCSNSYEGAGGGASGSGLFGSFYCNTAGSYPFDCGSSGLGGYQSTNGSGDGLAGGTSTFIGLSCPGGGAGVSPDDPSARGAGGLGPYPSIGSAPAGIAYQNNIILAGNDGADGSGGRGIASQNALAGNGAPSILGGGAGRGAEVTGTSAKVPGAGGGGAFTANEGNGLYAGGNGASGYLILETLAAISPTGS